MHVTSTSTDLIIEQPPFVFAKEWHKHFPPMLVVSITNVCNERCVHCYYKEFIKRPEYRKSFLNWEIWEKICEETGQWPEVILNFGTDGEPLLHPDLLNMLRLARQHSIAPINITTNGTLMNDAFNKTIVEENLIDVMNISLDAFRQETYKKIRGGSLKKVVNNVYNLIRYRNQTSGSLKIQVNIIDQPEARDEVEDFKTYWEQYVDNVLIRTYYDATSVTGQTGPNMTGKQEKFEDVERWPCQQLWRRFNIADDGTVRFCVDDWFNTTKIGHLEHQSIAEIWTGEAYNRLRHLHIAGHYPQIPYCAKCTEWQGMKWNYDYFTAMSKLLGKDVL